MKTCFLLLLATLGTAFGQSPRPMPALSEGDIVHLRQSIPATATVQPAAPRRVLIYNFTRGIYHDEAIVWATRALELMGEKTGAFTTTASYDASIFTAEKLREFDAVVMNNTMLKVFGPPEVEEVRMRTLVDFVKGGKGLVGIHAANVWEKDATSATDAEFRQLIGGRFRNHPWEFEPAGLRIEDPAHPLNAAWGGKTALPLPWREEFWSVQDGCITGITRQGGIAENNFLIWTGGEPAEFDLKLSYKLEGGNSGIYFHAKERAPGSKAEMLVGPQADFSADHVWTGVVMEYLLREKLAERGRKVLYTDKGERKDAGSVGDPKELLKSVRDRDWNDYHVIVRNNLIVLRINDVVMSEVRDHDPRRALSGLLALQVHTGPPMKVQFKNVRLRELKP